MIIWGLLLFSVGALAVTVAEGALHRQQLSGALLLWGEHLALPLGRALCLALFIAGAYPNLYGLDHAPGWGELMATRRSGFSSLLFVLFLAGIVMPLLPWLRTLPALTLPLQGGVGVALVFSWLCDAQRRELSVWPDGATLGGMVFFWVLAILVARLMGRLESPALRRDLHDLLLLWLQVPALIVYGQHLGARLQP